MDNQYLGLRKKALSIIKWMDIVPIKRLKTHLGLPRRYVVLSDFMLYLVFVGNHGLEDKSNRLKDVLQHKQEETLIEKCAYLLMKVYEYYLDHWKFKIFDRGRSLYRNVFQ